MSSEQQQPVDVILKLDADRRKEIDAIKSRFEEFMRQQDSAQLKMTHSMEIVAEGQRALKERFEVGTAGTLKELKGNFDKFLQEWGEQRAENKRRDERIEDANDMAREAKTTADKAKDFVSGIVMKFSYALFGSAALVALIWGLSKVLKSGG